jgi:hypothetical protein
MPAKWVDNVLSHHSITGVAKARQGIARRLTPHAILNLEVAIRLSDTLSIPTARALELARELMERTGELSTGKGITLTLDVEAIRADLCERLAHAVEIAPLPRRGRPAKR